MASMLKSGTQSLQMTGLTPELSYVIFAFGMDLRGNITSNLSSTQFKTTADGYSAGPELTAAATGSRSGSTSPTPTSP